MIEISRTMQPSIFNGEHLKSSPVSSVRGRYAQFWVAKRHILHRNRVNIQEPTNFAWPANVQAHIDARETNKKWAGRVCGALSLSFVRSDSGCKKYAFFLTSVLSIKHW